MSKRTDIHRPGAIVPADYAYVISYSLPGMDPGLDPAWNLKEARAICEEVGWTREGRMWGHIGKCGVCGACYRHGDIWRHEPTGHLVHMGHDCASKYELFASRDDWNAAMEAQKRNRRARLEAILRDARLADYLEAAPPYMTDVFTWAAETLERDEAARAAIRDGDPEREGLPPRRDPRAVDAFTVMDMRSRVRRFGSLSAKAEDFACALYSRALCPERPPPRHVPAPTGRVEITGVCISRKVQEGYMGNNVTKCTFKVTTPAGEWLCWGSVFFAYKDDYAGFEVGQTVRFRATLVAGREKHFAFYKRPIPLDKRPPKPAEPPEPPASDEGAPASEDPFAPFAEAV